MYTLLGPSGENYLWQDPTKEPRSEGEKVLVGRSFAGVDKNDPGVIFATTIGGIINGNLYFRAMQFKIKTLWQDGEKTSQSIVVYIGTEQPELFGLWEIKIPYQPTEEEFTALMPILQHYCLNQMGVEVTKFAF